MIPIEDSHIVDLYLARDERAINFTAEKYGKMLRHIAERICNDASTAEECENDTYLHVWDSIPPHEPRTYFSSFLSKITRFIALDRYKESTAQKRNADFTEITEEIESTVPASNDTAAETEAAFLSKAVSNYLRTIPEEKRNIFIRRYWFMDSVTEIAKRYRLTEGKVKTTLFRVRNDLKIYLEKEGYEI